MHVHILGEWEYWYLVYMNTQPYTRKPWIVHASLVEGQGFYSQNEDVNLTASLFRFCQGSVLIVLNAQCAQCLICIDQYVPRPPVLRLLQRLAQIPPEPRHSQFLLLTSPREQNCQDWCKINRWPLHDFRCINLFPLTTRRSTIIDFQCFSLFLLITDKRLLTSDAHIPIISSSIRQVTTWYTDLRY